MKPLHRVLALFAAAAVLVASALLACSGKSSSSKVVVVEEGEKALYKDITKESGIDFTYKNGEDDVVLAIIESLGGGVGVIDFDKDGLPDLFFPGGGYYEGKNVLGNPCKLYRNLGNMKFQDVTKEVGLEDVKWCYAHAVSVADFDCDGWPDLLVSGYNRLHLLHNEKGPDGKRRFVDVTEKAKLTEKIWSASTAFGDLDGDGYPELYVCHYGDWGFDTNHPTDCSYGGGKKRDVCQPGRFKPLLHSLYKNNKDGTFTDISSILKPVKTDGSPKGGHGLGVLFVDVNGDGRPDIYVCNDTDDNYLYANRGKPGEIKLEEVGLFAGVARDDRGNQNGSMGVDASSYNRSGKPSIIVTNYENELPALYLNKSGGDQFSFGWGSNVSGLAAIGGNYVSWGTAFFDAENTGWEDLLIVSGHAIRYPDAKFGRLQKPVFMKNESGKLKRNNDAAGTYFNEMHNARGVVAVDLDNDGKLDLVISHLNAPVTVLKNVGASGNHWLGVELITAKNHSLVGARVTITVGGETQYRFCKGGGSYASAPDTRLHFGLQAADKVDSLKVEWPGGKVSEKKNLKADQFVRIEEE